MGFLLLQYEYQRATRKYNSCVATGMRLDNRIERATKRISKIESIYDKAETQLKSKYSRYESQMSQQFQSVFSQLYAGNNTISSLQNAKWGGVVCQIGTIDTNLIAQLASDDSSKKQSAIATIISQLNAAMTLLKEQLEADMEKEQAKLDEKEEAQLEPINTENTELEAQQTCNETLTTMWQERKEAAKDRLGDNIKSGIAHYGIS